MKPNMKVRRVEITPHVAHSRISPHSLKISGFQSKLLYAVAYVDAVLLGFRNSSLYRRCARLHEVLPSTNHPIGFRPVRGCCKLAPQMSKIIRRFRDIAVGARPPTAEIA